MPQPRFTARPQRAVASFDRNRWSGAQPQNPFPANSLSAIFASEQLARLARACRPAFAQKGRTLFEEGEFATGVYFIVEGAARVFSASARGKTLLLSIAGPGSILGLPTAILGWRHQTSAEIVAPSRVGVMRREELLRFLHENNGVACQVLEHLSEDCYRALTGAKTIGLAENAGEKIARLLLQICPVREGAPYRAPSTCYLRHEDIAQMLGIARETASRLLSNLKRRQIVECRNSSISVRDRRALERIAGLTDSGAPLSGRFARQAWKARAMGM